MEKIFLYFLFTVTAIAGSNKFIHNKAILVDTHNDVLQRVIDGEDISDSTKNGHSDLHRMKKGGVDVQFFSVWCGDNYGKGTAFKRALQQIDSLKSVIVKNPKKIALAKNENEIHKILTKNKIAALIGVEGGHMLEDSLLYLDSLSKLGMKYLTLTWNNSTSWATSATDETTKKDSLTFIGLTEFGKKIVKRMNDLGVMIDLSHVGEKTFWDVINTTAKPVLVSHSSVYTICPSRRNLKDEQIRAVAKNKGVICINFYSGFIDSTYQKNFDAIYEKNKFFIDSIRAQNGSSWQTDIIIESVLAPQFAAIRPPLSLLIDHIEYVAKMVGVDYVGIGSDFDGIESLPNEMDDASMYPNITRELLKRGYSVREIEKILGGNVLRVLRANEAKNKKPRT